MCFFMANQVCRKQKLSCLEAGFSISQNIKVISWIIAFPIRIQANIAVRLWIISWQWMLIWSCAFYDGFASFSAGSYHRCTVTCKEFKLINPWVWEMKRKCSNILKSRLNGWWAEIGDWPDIIASNSSATVFFSTGAALSPFTDGFEGLRLGNLMWDDMLLVSSFHNLFIKS